jgi:polyhydroxyalkanoate synthesis regulator phasin
VTSGELSAAEGQALREKLLSIEVNTRGATEEEQLERFIHERGLASRHEVDELMKQIEALSSRLEKLHDEEKE